MEEEEAEYTTTMQETLGRTSRLLDNPSEGEMFKKLHQTETEPLNHPTKNIEAVETEVHAKIKQLAGMVEGRLSPMGQSMKDLESRVSLMDKLIQNKLNDFENKIGFTLTNKHIMERIESLETAQKDMMAQLLAAEKKIASKEMEEFTEMKTLKECVDVMTTRFSNEGKVTSEKIEKLEKRDAVQDIVDFCKLVAKRQEEEKKAAEEKGKKTEVEEKKTEEKEATPEVDIANLYQNDGCFNLVNASGAAANLELCKTAAKILTSSIEQTRRFKYTTKGATAGVVYGPNSYSQAELIYRLVLAMNAGKDFTYNPFIV